MHRGAHAATVALGQDPGKLLKFDFPSRTPKTSSVRPCTWLCLVIVIYCILLDGQSNWGHTSKHIHVFLVCQPLPWCIAGAAALHQDKIIWEMLVTDSTPVDSRLSLLLAIYKIIIVAVMSSVFWGPNKLKRESSLENNFMFKSVKRGKTNKIIPPIIKWQSFPWLVWHVCFPICHLIKHVKNNCCVSTFPRCAPHSWLKHHLCKAATAPMTGFASKIATWKKKILCCHVNV